MLETAGFLDHDGARLAWRRVEGSGPTIVWLGGFHSEMAGTKAEALARWAIGRGHGYLRFDYFGHGASEGRFEDGTISRWRSDALAVIDRLTTGRLVLVGSSMGGWLACLAALARPERIAGLVLIAPAADFTSALLSPRLPPQAHEALARDGLWTRPSRYDAEGYPITRALLEDGARWTILPGPIAIDIPVRILQGAKDPDVPWEHALALARALKTPDTVFTLIGDGDHRLSRSRDIRRLFEAVEELVRERRGDTPKLETILMPLAGEGTAVWAPVQAQMVAPERYRVLGPMPDDQEWRFEPGTIVRTHRRTFADGSEGLAAVD